MSGYSYSQEPKYYIYKGSVVNIYPIANQSVVVLGEETEPPAAFLNYLEQNSLAPSLIQTFDGITRYSINSSDSIKIVNLITFSKSLPEVILADYRYYEVYEPNMTGSGLKNQIRIQFNTGVSDSVKYNLLNDRNLSLFEISTANNQRWTAKTEKIDDIWELGIELYQTGLVEYAIPTLTAEIIYNSVEIDKSSIFCIETFPNPANPSATITYNLPNDAHTCLEIYSINGQKITTLVNEIRKEGEYSVIFDGSGYPSGIYLYRFKAGNHLKTGKVMLVK
jgi:hypothetical protein